MDIFSALSDPTRLKIVEMLALAGSLPVAKIKEPFDMSAPAISQHLKALLDAKLVEVERKAQSRIYKVNGDRIGEISNWATRVQAGLKPSDDLSGPRRRLSGGANKPIIAVENGRLEGFLRSRAKS